MKALIKILVASFAMCVISACTASSGDAQAERNYEAKMARIKAAGLVPISDGGPCHLVKVDGYWAEPMGGDNDNWTGLTYWITPGQHTLSLVFGEKYGAEMSKEPVELQVRIEAAHRYCLLGNPDRGSMTWAPSLEDVTERGEEWFFSPAALDPEH